MYLAPLDFVTIQVKSLGECLDGWHLGVPLRLVENVRSHTAPKRILNRVFGVLCLWNNVVILQFWMVYEEPGNLFFE